MSALTNAAIKAKWSEIIGRGQPGGLLSNSMFAVVIELVRWAEEQSGKAALSMVLPERCDCGKPFDHTGACEFCGAHARYP